MPDGTIFFVVLVLVLSLPTVVLPLFLVGLLVGAGGILAAGVLMSVGVYAVRTDYLSACARDPMLCDSPGDAIVHFLLGFGAYPALAYIGLWTVVLATLRWRARR